MKKLFQFLMMVSIALMVTSCYNDQLPAVPLPANVSFQKDIQPLFNKNCIGCHNGAQAPNLTTGNSYAALTTLNVDGEYFVTAGDAPGSIIYQALIGKGAPQMPPNGALSASKLAIVEKWINDGALNN
ncbi:MULTISPECIES: c-type cytochrome [unclassified Flavobacterium]|jgi:hypothetical protein|uniref:c-type cytochrome n=1 Tax=unclassified Flavobacterium TaxID=196869 RepID=UPI0025C0143C|nr:MULTISPECIES: c-type cytochrome [unclassified Flavobacterium]